MHICIKAKMTKEYCCKSVVKSSFKEYVVNNNIPKVIEKLKSGLIM
jgi:hypothetical protein